MWIQEERACDRATSCRAPHSKERLKMAILLMFGTFAAALLLLRPLATGIFDKVSILAPYSFLTLKCSKIASTVFCAKMGFSEESDLIITSNCEKNDIL